MEKNSSSLSSKWVLADVTIVTYHEVLSLAQQPLLKIRLLMISSARSELPFMILD
jgi:hypothetical protein